jgi:hypothetical protein
MFNIKKHKTSPRGWDRMSVRVEPTGRSYINIFEHSKEQRRFAYIGGTKRGQRRELLRKTLDVSYRQGNTASKLLNRGILKKDSFATRAFVQHNDKALLEYQKYIKSRLDWFRTLGTSVKFRYPKVKL